MLKLHKWKSLNRTQRLKWLMKARDAKFSSTHEKPDAAARHEFAIEGSNIDNLLGFLAALGEAVNGPGGYMGISLGAMIDCLYGGFGVTLPFRLRIKNSSQCQANLGNKQLVIWAKEQLAQANFHDEEGENWLMDLTLGAGQYNTLFDLIVGSLREHEVEVILED